MPTIIRCPSCTRSLTLPDDLVGQLVKCPSCEEQFTAQEETGTTPSLPPPMPMRDEPREEPPPRRDRRQSWGDDEDEYYRRPRYGSRAEASSEVSGPATALQVASGLGLAGAVLSLFAIICAGAGNLGQPGPRGGMRNDPGEMIGLVVNLIMIVISIVCSSISWTGATKMKNLESYGWATAGSIIAMLPVHGCCLLGLPFGIWALVVINKPHVRNAFPGQGS